MNPLLAYKCLNPDRPSLHRFEFVTSVFNYSFDEKYGLTGCLNHQYAQSRVFREKFEAIYRPHDLMKDELK